MAELPDVYCWIKVISDDTGKVLPDGGDVTSPNKAIVRYVVANDSDKPAGPLTIVGALYKDGVKVQPGGQSNVVPAQQITVQPNQIWKQEYTVTDPALLYVAKILGDVGNVVNEEDEANNQAQRTFRCHKAIG